MTKKRSLYVINEHFESFFNAVFASILVVQMSLQVKENPFFYASVTTTFAD